MSDNDAVVVESTLPLDSGVRKEMSEWLKTFKLINPEFVGKLVVNINQGGITSVAQSRKMLRVELKKMFAVAEL